MPLEFHNDAICLSGETGTKLKSGIIGSYYDFWWNIVSGGKKANNNIPTSIVEMNAATGEVYIKDTDEILLGSAGHALELRIRNKYKTRNLRLILIEEDEECFSHLCKVISRKWSSLPADLAEDSLSQEAVGVYLYNSTLEEVLDKLDEIKLGMTLYFFDPLLYVKWKSIEQVATKRIVSPFRTGTEFIVFLFTSDWFLGRDSFVSLPNSSDESEWSEQQRITVKSTDELFGNKKWHKKLLKNVSIEKKQKTMVNLYRHQLLKWFRYVLPLPFKPKKNQLYHLFFCSNYELGIRVTKDFYISKTGNPKFMPDNREAYYTFKIKHPDRFQGLKGNQRPSEWKILWAMIKEHEGGICDPECRNLKGKVRSQNEIYSSLSWLANQRYIKSLKKIDWVWDDEQFPRYEINWKKIVRVYNIEPPPALIPIERIL